MITAVIIKSGFDNGRMEAWTLTGNTVKRGRLTGRRDVLCGFAMSYTYQ
jgi:hypothetical protein